MIGPDDFQASDRPLLSGAVHYFRSLPEQWPQRLEMLRALGAQAVETYVPWNFHERRRGEFDFSGRADLERFLRTAAELGLAAIVRPGPYICAEWENGGLPSWLRSKDARLPLRCADPRFLEPAEAWFDELLPRIAAAQHPRGGNVIAVQIENEYGSYGSDAEYLSWLRERLLAGGIEVPLFTSDGPTEAMLTCGTLPGVPATVNFGSRPDRAFAVLRERRPRDRRWCMEFWNGWFDHWGEGHHVRDPEDAAAVLDRMLSADAGVNLYMAHGGTNFGVWSGANCEDGFQPTVTSYDYDAPIDERGAATAKFHAFRRTAAKHLGEPPPIPEPAPLLAPRGFELTRVAALSGLDDRETVVSATPSTFEELGLDNGLVRYRHRLRGPREAQDLTLPDLADRAQVFCDGELLATVERNDPRPIRLEAGPEGALIEILVESMGRVNFGPRVGELKGLVGGVRLGGQTLHGWEQRPIAVDPFPQGVDWGAPLDAGPAFFAGNLRLDEVGDAYLALPGWTKGYVWVDGFCLGRFWDRGPQRTLYLPQPLLRRGDNEVTVLELHPGAARKAELRDRPDLGPIAP